MRGKGDGRNFGGLVENASPFCCFFVPPLLDIGYESGNLLQIPFSGNRWTEFMEGTWPLDGWSPDASRSHWLRLSGLSISWTPSEPTWRIAKVHRVVCIARCCRRA